MAAVPDNPKCPTDWGMALYCHTDEFPSTPLVPSGPRGPAGPVRPVGPSGPPIQAPQYATQQTDIATLKASLATSYSDTVWVQRNG